MTSRTETIRAGFRAALSAPEPVLAPLALDALTARLAESAGYGAVYLSGGALGYAHAVSEALLSLTELADTAHHLTARTGLPLIVDGGVGFGDPVHVHRTIGMIEATGAAAIEIEDQVAPKRASHHRHIEHLISTEEMVAKIAVAVEARTDPDFLLIARTGAVSNESWEAAIERCSAYREAGADILMLFPDSWDRWAEARQRLDAPLAGMTMFDRRTPEQWAELGWALIIDPMTGQVVAFDAVRQAYAGYLAEGRSGQDRRHLAGVYDELATFAGMAELYAIEDRTTESG